MSSSQQHISSTSSSIKTTTVVSSVDDACSPLLLPPTITTTTDSPSSPQEEITQFTTLIEKQVLHNIEREESITAHSAAADQFEYDEVECDQEINRITTTSTSANNASKVEHTIDQEDNLSPEPSGENLEMVGLICDNTTASNNHSGVGGVEFEEFIMGDDLLNTNLNNLHQDNITNNVSSKKSSSKSIQQSTIQSSSVNSSVETNVVVKEERHQQSTDNMIESNQQAAIQENGVSPKKTKVERKSSKAGGGKKTKSNAEISKENISVSLTNGQPEPENNNNIKKLNQQQQQQSNNNIVPDELVKKLGPGESRVFAKVCVANLRRSFGDLTVINSSNASNDLLLIQNNKYSNSLEYNNRVASSREMKKSSFSKFDSLVSKNSNAAAATALESKECEQESAPAAKPEPKKMYCASCEKQVFQMELIRAEKKDWHKNCFRCVTCRKVLSVDTYQSHEQRLYCKPHFKELFQPKAVVNDESSESSMHELETQKKPKLQLIICESQPKELPPDVVRASDTPSTGLEDIQIDVRSKFEMFEGLKEKNNGSKSPVLDSSLPVKRSASVLAKLKKYENSASGTELNGVCDEDLNGVEGIELQSEEEEEDEGGNSVIKEEIKRKLKNPLQALNEIAHFKQMEQVRSKWEEGTFTRDQMNADSRKEELQKFRSRLCQGKSGQLKELYEKGLETTEGVSSARQAEIEELKSERARAYREMFEKGEVIRVNDDEDQEEGDSSSTDLQGNKKGGVDLEVFEAGVARESKKIFEEMDKRIVSEQQMEVNKKQRVVNKIKPSGSFVQSMVMSGGATAEIVRSSDKADEPIQVNTAELSNKFKFFETYEDELARKKMEAKRETFKRITPPREDGVVKTEKDYEDNPDGPETYRDPAVVRHGETQEDDTLTKSKTTSKMLSVFRQMEENLSKGEGNKDPIIRPLKQFTPPRDTVGNGRVPHDSEEDPEDEGEEEEEDEEEESEGEEAEQSRNMVEDDFLKEVGSLARARSLRAKFERWEQQENERNKGGVVTAAQEELAESIESARNLKAKFEAMRLMESSGSTNSSSSTGSNNKENKRSPVLIRVNRFVLNGSAAPAPPPPHPPSSDLSSNLSSSSTSPLQYTGFNSLPAEPTHNNNHNNHHHHHLLSQSPVLIMSSGNEQCAMCEKRVYAMEKIEAGGKMYHKNCFRCSQCKCILRMDTFTSNKGTLFCTTHFKQLFKIKGNYDEGFGHETQVQVWAKKQAAAQQN